MQTFCIKMSYAEVFLPLKNCLNIAMYIVLGLIKGLKPRLPTDAIIALWYPAAIKQHKTNVFGENVLIW
jgi:hypothetical protein